MDTTSAFPPSSLSDSRGSRSILRLAAIGGLAATAVNLALWAAGRAADVGFLVTPIGADSASQVGFVPIALTTLFMFALGSGLLALAARRSARWVSTVMVTAAAFTVVSIGGPLSTAEDTASAVLLAMMHLITGAAFLATAAKMRAR